MIESVHSRSADLDDIGPVLRSYVRDDLRWIELVLATFANDMCDQLVTFVAGTPGKHTVNSGKPRDLTCSCAHVRG